MTNRPGTYEMSMPDDDQHSLRLQRVRSTDVGQLVVTASNQFGSDLCTLQLAMAGQFRHSTVLNLAFLLHSRELGSSRCPEGQAVCNLIQALAFLMLRVMTLEKNN